MTLPNESRVGLSSNLLVALAGGACFLLSGVVTFWASRMQGDGWYLTGWLLGLPLLLYWVRLLRRTLLLSITVTSTTMKLRYLTGDCSIGLNELQGVILYRPAGTSGTGLVLDLADGSRVGIPAAAAETRRILKLLRRHVPGLPAQRRFRTLGHGLVRDALS